MNIGIVTPAPPGSHYGNRITAVRWAAFLKDLGQHVRVVQNYEGFGCELLIALHARRSAPAVAAFHQRFPGRPSVVILTGTDLYQDLPKNVEACRTLETASLIVVLQDKGLEDLAPHLRGKARVIYQSATALRPHWLSGALSNAAPMDEAFTIGVIGHLRPVKDPFRAAKAARLLPPASRARILQAGAAMTPEMEEEARAEQQSNPRYKWLGEMRHGQARALLRRCNVCVVSSLLEGGANIIAEAVVDAVPVLASRIPGNVGMLGESYPGYFPCGDSQALAKLLRRAETEPGFLRELRARCHGLASRFTPRRERTAISCLLRELFPYPFRANPGTVRKRR